MVDRNKYDKYISGLKEINAHNAESGISSSIQQIEMIKSSFDIKVMVVGHFNAGKSSLLNGLIGRPGFLKEAQLPQTAIATEIVFDENEAAFAYKEDGSRETILGQGTFFPSKYSHLEYRLPITALKQISDFTIVDTPGFDSGIEEHTNALANYIGVGSAYIVVIDQEKGGVDGTTLRFIDEISHYSNQIAVLINKCDKITEQTAKDIALSAEATLLSRGFPYKVYTISRNDPDVAEKMISIISSFNAQEAFNRVIRARVYSELFNAEKILQVVKQRLYLDTFDLDAEILAYSQTKEQLAYTFEQKRKEAEQNLSLATERIISEVRSILISRADSVAEALLSGNQVAAEAIIVESIRPVILSSMKDISIRQIDSITDALDFTGLVSDEAGEALSSIALNLANTLKALIEQGVFETKSLKDLEAKSHNENVYHAVTGIAALATDIIAPWMEVIIILLPDIISLVRSVLGDSDHDVAKKKFINNVIPQICNKIFPQIKQNVDNSTNQVLDEYKQMLDEKVELLKKNVVAAEEKKKEKEVQFEDHKKRIIEDIALIHKMLQELE